MSQFSSISRGTGDGRTYVEPASTFVEILAVSNFDVLTFGHGCIVPHATFYTDMALKSTVLPLGPVALLWIWAVLKGKPDNRKTATKFSLLWVEMVLTIGKQVSYALTRSTSFIDMNIDSSRSATAPSLDNCDSDIRL